MRLRCDKCVSRTWLSEIFRRSATSRAQLRKGRSINIFEKYTGHRSTYSLQKRKFRKQRAHDSSERQGSIHGAASGGRGVECCVCNQAVDEAPRMASAFIQLIRFCSSSKCQEGSRTADAPSVEVSRNRAFIRTRSDLQITVLIP